MTLFEDVYPSENDLKEKCDQIICDVCKRLFSNRGALRMHAVKTHRQLNLPTDISLQSRSIHVAQKKKRFHCPKCEKVYDSNRSLSQHFQKVHGSKTYECEGCSAKFSLERDLRYHAKKFCYNLRDQPKESNIRKPKIKKMKVQETQTDNIVIKLIISKKPKIINCETQTEDPILDCQLNSNYSYDVPETSDFAGQYDQSYGEQQNMQQFNSNVSTYDQATMYDNFPGTSSNYINQSPEMVDVSTYVTEQNYFIDQSCFLTQTTQTYFNPEECPYSLDETDYRQMSQTHSSTQTTQPLESWFGKNQDQIEGNNRDMSSMTDQYY